MLSVTFEAIDEDQPAEKWRRAFDRHWHGYSRWFVREGVRARPSYLASLKALRKHMPELVPAYERVVECAGGGDLEARFLSMWCPPVYIGGCSQAIVTGRDPFLIRNYDYAPRLFEGTWLATRLCGRRVVAVSDCLWGVLDGINESGLAASLSFGGRPIAGEGFGVPIVLRYVLEAAQTTAEAIAILKRVPVNMSYTVALLDRSGDHATVYVNPDRPAEVSQTCASTNHQLQVEWPRHAKATRSVERKSHLETTLARSPSRHEALEAFLRPPLRQSAYDLGYGTLYTAVYAPEELSIELVWPQDRWRQTCIDFREGTRLVNLQSDESSSEPRSGREAAS